MWVVPHMLSGDFFKKNASLQRFAELKYIRAKWGKKKLGFIVKVQFVSDGADANVINPAVFSWR